MGTEYNYQNDCDNIDDIKMEEKLELKDNERFVVCGSCVKHTRKVKKGSDEPFFERCDKCTASVQSTSLEVEDGR